MEIIVWMVGILCIVLGILFYLFVEYTPNELYANPGLTYIVAGVFIIVGYYVWLRGGVGG